jgi:iron complex outermembrane receptor protein
VIDLRSQNIAQLRTRGFDVRAEYPVELGSSSLSLGLLGTYLLKYSQAAAPADPLHSVLNTPHYPIDLRSRGTITWSRGPFTVTTSVNYQHGYRDTDSTPVRSVRSWTTEDLVIGFTYPDFDAGTRDRAASPETRVALRVSNLMNSSPPFLNNALEHIGYDEENGNLLGRIVSVTVRESW